jgi:hypothetical protein
LAIVANSILLIWDFSDPAPDADPSKNDLIGFLLILVAAGGICALEWEKFPFRISKIGPIELGDVVSGQVHEHAVAVDELRKRIEKLEEGQRRLALDDSLSVEPPSTQSNEREMEAPLERFLSKYNSPFSPSRIVTWGSRQTGFEALSQYQPDQVRRVLQSMIADGKLETGVSQKGNALYRIARC